MEIKNQKIEINRSEEVQDIVDRMPEKGSRFVLAIVCGLALLLLLFGYLIKYPEVVTGVVTITMGKAPVKLVAKSSGRLSLLGNQVRQYVSEGEIIALIDNTTDFHDYLLVDSLLVDFSLSERDSVLYDFPDNMSLGELNGGYYQFLDAYREYYDYLTQNLYALKEEAIRLQVVACRESIDFIRQQLIFKKDQLDYYRREVSRDSFCLALGDYSERALDRTRNTYNSMLEAQTGLLASLSQQEIRLNELKNQLG